jgi:hypothetical protein
VATLELERARAQVVAATVELDPDELRDEGQIEPSHARAGRVPHDVFYRGAEAVLDQKALDQAVEVAVRNDGVVRLLEDGPEDADAVASPAAVDRHRVQEVVPAAEPPPDGVVDRLLHARYRKDRPQIDEGARQSSARDGVAHDRVGKVQVLALVDVAEVRGP